MTKKNEYLLFSGHLDELRHRLIKCILAVIFFSFLVYYFVEDILKFIVQPIGKVVFTAPADAFVVYLTLTMFSGALLSFPVILYQFWCFVAGGLKPDERKYALAYGPFSLLFFLFGGAFAYFIIMPVSLKFLLSFSNDIIVPMITIKSYVSFVGTTVIIFGVIFELPLVLMFLTKIGIATPDFLIQKRKYAIVLIFIISAIVTPPDMVSQLMMAGPLMVLYEIGIWASKLVKKRNF